jgi:hypothetical protein
MRGRRAVVAGVTAVIVAMIGMVFLVMFIAGWRSVPVDRIGLHYTGGPIEGQEFVEVIEPGSGARFMGLLDSLVLLPVTQRDYTASSAEGADGPPIVAPARGGVEMQFDVAAYFTLNTSDDVVRRFYERVCIKFDCDDEDGWDEMLRVNFRGPIEQAIQQSIREFTVDELYAGVGSVDESDDDDAEATAVLEQVQNTLAADLKENINNVLGGAYFCGPTFERSQPDECPDFQFQITSAVPTSSAVRDAFAENAASQRQVVTAQNRADAAAAEADGQRRAQEALAGIFQVPGYVAYLEALAMQACADNPNCTLVFTPDGTDVNVNTGAGG